MKKLLAGAFAALMVAFVLSGCSASADKYTVIQTDYTSYIEYDIVYYRHDSTYKDNVITGYIDESHFPKSEGWTADDVLASIEQVYPGFNSMSFTTSRVTDEGDYYCCICMFDDLDKLANIRTLHENGVLFKQSAIGSGDDDALIGSDYFIQSIKFNFLNETKELTESEVQQLGLHFESMKK